MEAYLLEWGSMLLRWLHVTAAIAWIGSSFMFMHLDASLRKEKSMAPGVSGVSWQVHGGGFYEWDTAAPVAVARAAGCHASRIDGSPLAYNQPDLLMPDILVCRPDLAGPILQAIREVTDAP